jgi:acetylornithine deacetylase/succinyl-diaminopimelate desuccinylase-like protein
MRLVSFFLAAALAHAQDRVAIERYTTAHQSQIMAEFTELLSIPNVGTDRANIRRNAEFIRAMLERHGMKAELLETAGNPLVYAEKNQPGADKTILFYIHYDGQPVDPAKWKQASPFQPIMRDGRMEEDAKVIPNFAAATSFLDNWRLYARSASDDKAPIVAFCAALDAIGGRTASNIT